MQEKKKLGWTVKYHDLFLSLPPTPPKVLAVKRPHRQETLPPICPSNGKRGRQKTTVVLTHSNATLTQFLAFADSPTLRWHIICSCCNCDH